jgi:hypothetical protein
MGLFCSTEGKCSKQCGQLLGQACEDGLECSSDGRCTEPGAAGPSGGSNGGFGNSDAGVPAPGTAGTAGTAPPQPNVCADTRVNATRLTPTVILIIDQSSSMDEDFQGGTTRWQTLKDFLLAQDPDGLIADLQGQVNFGLAMYSAESAPDGGLPLGECPIVTTVAPGPDNFEAIRAVYEPAGTIEDTPTGDSIDKIIDDLGLATPDPDAQDDPIVFILATDGEPDRCEELDPQNGQDEAIAAVERAFSLGIRTFIISVGEGTVSAEHQQAVANAGLGVQPGEPDAEYWEAGNDASLRAALTEIVGGQLGCDVQLNGSVEGGDACLGKVMLNGSMLPCDDPDGWELTSPNTIRINGAACDSLKSTDFVLEVSFPCSVKVVD